MRALRLVPILAVVAIALLGLVAWLLARREATTFNVTAHTEWMEFSPVGGSQTAWRLDDVQRVDAGGRAARFSGTFEPAEGARVRVERIARGPLFVEVEPPAASSPSEAAARSAGVLDPDDGSRRFDAGPYAAFLVGSLDARADSGANVLIPIAGRVDRVGHRVGRTPTGSSALLQSGKVTLLGRAIFGDQVFEAGGVELDPGDLFEIRDTSSSALGFVVADDRPGLLAAYRTTGTIGWVQRPGGGEYPVSISVLTRLVHDPLFRVVAMVGGWLVALATLLTFALEARATRT